MEKVSVHKAVGMVLGHDITKIVPNQFKGRVFKKGHIIEANDIPIFLNLGKEHIYVFNTNTDKIHENEAAIRIAQAGGQQIFQYSEPKEGKVNLIAPYSGLLKVDKGLLKEINSIGEIIFATLHNNMIVAKGQVVAGTRIIPLIIEEEPILHIERLCQTKELITVKPFKKYKVGIVTTGNEVYSGRIKDGFCSVLENKIRPYDSVIIEQIIVPDDKGKIKKAIHKLLKKGAEIILTTGGMSIDPDDVTPSAIKELGAEIVTYGAPVLPGSMFLMGYLRDIPILGLPGCVMYSKTTIFDLILPKVLVGERITKDEMIALGHGGLCLDCDQCFYPKCGFGKGD